MSALTSCCRRGGDALPRDVYANDTAANSHFVNNRISNNKYTVWSFIPKNLMEQFSLAMNKYFLLIACLQLWAEVTPVNPATTWGPLLVIFSITAVRELLDDLGRRRRDKLANTRRHIVVRGGKEVPVSSEEIVVGDIVKLVEDEEVPCDCVLLATSEPNGNCFIQTTNLDGESNLKSRVAHAATRAMTTPRALGAFKGFVHAPPPDDELYSFDAQLRMSITANAEVLSLDAQQLLLQATHIRNTEFLYGMAVYTGNETKFGNNKRDPAPKLTSAEKVIDRFTLIIFTAQLLLVIIFGIIGNVWKGDDGESTWYLRYPSDESWYTPVIIPLRFLLLNSTMIPISLKVTLDLCKLYYAKFVNADLQLVDDSGRPAEANSTALGEDLGQVKFVLSDKTGTLTQNVMVLKCCTIGGTMYGNYRGDTLGAGSPAAGAGAGAGAGHRRGRLASNDSRGSADGGGGASGAGADSSALSDPALHSSLANQDPLALNFMRCLALNNSVIPSADEATGRIRYKASSPDEEALVRGAASFGVALTSRVVDRVNITMLDTTEAYTQLHELEFDSVRKRMSVIVRNNSTKAVQIYVKGADDVVLPRLDKSRSPQLERVRQQVDTFAAAGLRTLVVAYRDLSNSEYQAWLRVYNEANTSMQDRQAKKWAAYKRIEDRLVLLGATAIEDKLQVGVPETIALLKEAGLKFWMLTGDKPSTALTIALTCRLMPKANQLRPVEGEDQYEVGRQIAQHLQELSIAPALATPASAPAASSSTPHGRSNSRDSTRRRRNHSGDVESGGGGGGGKAIELATRRHSNSTNSAASNGSVRRARPPSSTKKKSRRPFTVIVKGSALKKALDHHPDDFAALVMAADSVICCRVSPAQKAKLVMIVKNRGELTLAIGDGGNDVAMIQAAHMGIGIRGKEGLEASRAADYQVGMFRTLQRLMLVHGRWAYYRTALVAQYSFYKSFTFCFMQIGYTFYSAFSGTSMFNSLCVAAYNAILFVPIVFFFVDKDVSLKTIAQHPRSYAMGQFNMRMNNYTMLWWLLRALYHAVVMLLVCVGASQWAPSGAEYDTLGLTVFSLYLIVQDATMLLELRNVTWYNIISIFGMHVFALFMAFLIQLTTSFESFIGYKSLSVVLTDGNFWMCNIVGTFACIVPVEAVKLFLLYYVPSSERKLRQIDARMVANTAVRTMSKRPLIPHEDDHQTVNPAHHRRPSNATSSSRSRRSSGASKARGSALKFAKASPKANNRRYPNAKSV